MSNPVTYPLDLTGTNPANLVTNELHTTTEAHFRDYYFIVPNFSPFFVDNFNATIHINNVTTPLVEDVDFSFALPYVTGTRTTGKAMYGAITLHNLNLNGILSISYQTIGGDQIADRLQVLTLLADKAYNPRTTIWDILTNVPNAFPPVPHYQDYDSFYGQEELVTKLGEIRDAILANSSLTQNEIQQFLALLTNNGFTGGGGSTAYVNKSGDTMTGPLILAGPPTQSLHPATKQYVDSITNELKAYIQTIILSSPIYHYDDDDDTSTNVGTNTANKQYVDEKIDELKAYIQTIILSSPIYHYDDDDTSTNVGAGTNTGISTANKQYVDEKIDELKAYIQTIILNNPIQLPE